MHGIASRPETALRLAAKVPIAYSTMAVPPPKTSHHELYVFSLVVEGGGFSAAARALRTTPSAISRQMARLEGRLGVRLLHRNTRGVQATEPGRAYYESAREILGRVRALEESMERTRSAPSGCLRVSSPVALARRRLVPELAAFTTAHADLRVELVSSDRLVDFVSERVDVALRLGRLSDSSLTATRIAPERKIVCASPSYLARMGTPKAPRDLLLHHCLHASSQPSLNRWPLGEETIATSGRFEADNTDLLVDAALGGIGIGRFSDLVVAPFLLRGSLVEVLAEFPSGTRSSLSAVVPSGRLVPPKVRAFIAFVTALFRPSSARRNAGA